MPSVATSSAGPNHDGAPAAVPMIARYPDTETPSVTCTAPARPNPPGESQATIAATAAKTPTVANNRPAPLLARVSRFMGVDRRNGSSRKPEPNGNRAPPTIVGVDRSAENNAATTHAAGLSLITMRKWICFRNPPRPPAPPTPRLCVGCARPSAIIGLPLPLQQRVLGRAACGDASERGRMRPSAAVLGQGVEGGLGLPWHCRVGGPGTAGREDLHDPEAA